MNALEKLVPKELEQHLQLSYARFKTYDQSVCWGQDRCQDDHQQAVPMGVGALVDAVKGIKDIGALIKDSKGGKSKAGGKGKNDTSKACYLCGKTNHLAKDCWSKSKSKGKGADNQSKGKGKGSSSRSTSRSSWFQGRCNDSLGKEGHKGKDCWSKAGGKGKGGGKGSDSRRVSSLNHEPEKEAEAGGLDLCHLSSDLCDGWLRLNYDTGAAVTALPKLCKAESIESSGDRPFETALRERLDDMGKGTITGVDEGGRKRRDTGFDTWLGPGGGMLIEHSSRLYKELCKTYNRFGRSGEIPLYEERGVYNFESW